MRILIAAILAICFFALAESSAIDSNKLWNQYRSELLKFLRQGDSKAMPNLQLVTGPIPAEWDQMPETLQRIAGSIPKFSASWTPTTRTFSKMYHQFLTSLDLPAPNTPVPATLLKLEEDLFMKQMDLQMAESKCAMYYDNHTNMKQRGTVMTWEQFKQKFCFMVEREETSVLQLRAALEIEKVKSYGPMFDAAMALGRYSSTPVADRVFKPMGDLARFVRMAEVGMTNSFSVKLEHQTKNEVGETSTFGASISLTVPIASIPVSVGANYQKSEMKFTSNSEDMRLVFGAAGWKAIPVYPSKEAFDLTVLKTYKNGPFRKGSGKNNFFGRNGLMPLLPRTLFVMVKPNVEMLVNKQDASSFESSTSFGGSVGIGPIQFEFNKGDTLSKKSENKGLFAVLMEGKSPIPQLLAIDNYRLPQDL